MILSVFLSAFLAFSTPQTEAVSYWNSVLECYERLCNACIRNKDSKSIANIKGELDVLLKKPVGKMNGEQQTRFNEIRNRYKGVNIASLEKGGTDTIVIVKEIPVEKVKEIDHVVVYDTVKVKNNISTIVVEHQYSRKDTTIIIHTLGQTPAMNYAMGNDMKADLGRWFIGATAGFAPDFSAGIMAGIGKRSGFYIKARSNFKSISSSSSVDIRKDSFWSNGKSETTRISVSLGGWITLYKGLKIYIGGGYGESYYYIQNTSQDWVEISNSSYKSFAADCGIMYKLGRVIFFGGVNSVAFKYTDAEAGIAISLGK